MMSGRKSKRSIVRNMKEYSYHRNSRVAEFFAKKRGGTYIGYKDVEWVMGVVKDTDHSKNVEQTLQGAYVVEYNFGTLATLSD